MGKKKDKANHDKKRKVRAEKPTVTRSILDQREKLQRHAVVGKTSELQPEDRQPPLAARRSLAQQRAAHALQLIRGLHSSAAGENAEGVYGRYVSYVKALPATIIRNGLGQALAMERSAKKLKGHERLFEHLLAWLGGGDSKHVGWEKSPYREIVNGQKGEAGAIALFNAITDCSEDDYIRAQTEIMEYLEWLKKFAVAILVEIDKEQESADD